MQQAGGIQTRAGTEHAALGEIKTQRQLAGDDVTGVGDVDKHAIKAAGLDLVCIAADGGNGERHLRQAVMCFQQFDFADAVDDHIAFAQIGKITGAYRNAVGQIRCRIPQVLHLAGQLLLFLVYQHQFVGDALHRQRIRHMGAHMTQTDHTDNTFLCHSKNTPLMRINNSI